MFRQQSSTTAKRDFVRAHNPKVAGSNPAPATNTSRKCWFCRGFFLLAACGTCYHLRDFISPETSSIPRRHNVWYITSASTKL